MSRVDLPKLTAARWVSAASHVSTCLKAILQGTAQEQQRGNFAAMYSFFDRLLHGLSLGPGAVERLGNPNDPVAHVRVAAAVFLKINPQARQGVFADRSLTVHVMSAESFEVMTGLATEYAACIKAVEQSTPLAVLNQEKLQEVTGFLDELVNQGKEDQARQRYFL